MARKKKAMTVKKVRRVDIIDSDGHLKKSGAIKREHDLARERFFRKPYGKVWDIGEVRYDRESDKSKEVLESYSKPSERD